LHAPQMLWPRSGRTGEQGVEVVQPRGVRRTRLWSQSVRHAFRRDIHAMALTKIAEYKPFDT
jgi:hypothetical protein